VKVPWSHQRCVLCLGEPDPDDEQTWLTNAHVIPKSVGGRLSADFLCQRCNSRLGHTIESQLLSDPGIRLDIENVADQLPESLLNDMRERQRWFTNVGHDQVIATVDAAGELRPRESPSFLREENARALLESEWRKAALPEEDIRAHLEAFDEAQSGDELELPGFTVRRRVDLSPYDFSLPFDEPLVSDLLPLAIAYLYLALFFEDKVYETRQLQPIRDALLNIDTSASDQWRIDHRRHVRGAASEHRLAIKSVGPPLVVHVQLFGERVWWVEFKNVAFKSEPPRYGVRLTNDEEFSW
jgi:hypothetical protein